jgi:hypothetical protein
LDPDSESDKHRDVFSPNSPNTPSSEKSISTLIFEVMASFPPFGFRQLAELLVRPVVNHFVADQRDVFQIMEEALSEKLWFAGRKWGWGISM